MRIFRLGLGLATAVLLAGCTSAPDSPLTTTSPSADVSVTDGLGRYMEQRARVEAVGFRLRKAAVRHCAKHKATKPDLGLIVWSLANFKNPADRANLQNDFALTDDVTVALSIAGTPAQAAGLKAGQIVTHVNGKAVPQGKGATDRFIALANTAARDGAVTLRLSDDREVTLTPETVCEFPTLLVRSTEINAAADGQALAITSGLYDITRSDDELALVLGHELAHNVLGHLKDAKIAHPAGILDAYARAAGASVASGTNPPFSVAYEKEADYVGLYFMARAGYDITAAEAFWNRLNKSTRATSVIKTHPSGPERLKALQVAVAEIRAKQQANKPLEPDLKPRR